jgi:predicted O-linked N-acetylglucosamine transferase (SPINDLY family)
MAKNHASPVGGRVAARLQQAFAHFSRRELREAAAIYEEILKVHPRQPEALLRLGVIAGQTNDPEKAILMFDKAIACDPNNAAAFNNRGLALQALKRWKAALASYERAIALKPEHALAHFNRGNTLKDLARPDEAIDSYRKAIAIEASFADAHYNLGVILHERRQWDAALASYDRAIAARPRFAEALFNRGNILRELTRWPAALDSYDRAIAAKSDYPEAYLNRGDVLHSLKRRDQALLSYESALEQRAGYARGYLNRGNILRELKQLDAASASYDRAFEIAPELEYLQGMRRYARMQLSDWEGLDRDLARLAARIERDQPASPPFPTLVLSGSAELQQRAAQIWVRDRCPLNESLPSIDSPANHGRIRIGYFSADFHDHATAYLIAGLLELHERARFEVIAFSFGPESPGGMRARLADACDRFIDVRGQSDAEVACLARQMQIDIAVDLKGFTQDNRVGIFALRAAPVQVNYLGYPGTMGAEYMDYIIADRTLVPEQSQQYYTEKIVYLPDSYQVNDRKRAIAEKVFTRAELGLPENAFVFCCFNNNFKILPATFDVWMRILERVSGSVLWLFEDNPAAAANLRREAASRGVDAARLIFAGRMDLPEHLARHRAANLFLDTWPCNAHTTASDALWAGLPVLTCPGESFASRVAASLLSAVGLPELIAATPREYEDLAVALAGEPARLANLAQRLAECRPTAPLFDTGLYARRLESAYSMMCARQRAGLPPEHLFVPDECVPDEFVPDGFGSDAIGSDESVGP